MRDLKTWTGNIDEFARVAAEMLHRLGRTDERPPGIRLIRDYIQRGLLGDVPRQGRDLLFGYDQLVRFAAARVLLADGWPRAKIREYFAVSTTEEIAALVPGLEEVTRGEAGKGGERRRGQAAALPAPRKGRRTDQRAGFRERALSLSAVRVELFETLRRLDIFIDEPPRDEMIRFTIAPWCELFVDKGRLSAMTVDEVQDLGRAVADTLLLALMRKRRLGEHG